ncbi:alanine/ornithine racemase family PLP-dependent enzyme [Flavobacteriales bacterium]|nr:alanine/ornithine racemase family PLP-dependent enzyme [Flavobacteriales bacterium]
MPTPRIEINLGKVIHNTQLLKELYGSRGIDIIGVTKAVCGNPIIANALVKSGIKILGDSRISNIKKMRNAGVKAQFLLLRIPLLSQASDVVQYTEISLNSELVVIKKLSKFAVTLNITHKIILMVELGDLREGLLPTEVESTVKEILKLKGIELVGIGTNLACFGGIKPDEKNMGDLSAIANSIEEKFQLQLKFVSGGNSANYNWLISTRSIQRINNLRLGESIYLGRETLHRTPIPQLHTDAFILIAEVIESKTKASLPSGKINQNAHGDIPEFQDQGPIRRAILGIGLQDVAVSGLTPELDIDILGASSDHLIINAKQTQLKVGIEVSFRLNYAALLSAMTSPYVTKNIV